MKLVELLQEKYKTLTPQATKFDQRAALRDPYYFGFIELEKIKDELLKCDEFLNVEELIIMKGPSKEIKEGGKSKAIHSASHILFKDTKFKGIVYLHSIFLTPPIYDSSRLMSPINNKVLIFPAMEPFSLKPLKGLTIFFDVEKLQDNFEKGGEGYRNNLVAQFIKALENQKEYELPEQRNIIIRGVFTVEEPVPNTKKVESVNGKLEFKDEYEGIREIIELKNT